jgi:hypothetical protein
MVRAIKSAQSNTPKHKALSEAEKIEQELLKLDKDYTKYCKDMDSSTDYTRLSPDEYQRLLKRAIMAQNEYDRKRNKLLRRLRRTPEGRAAAKKMNELVKDAMIKQLKEQYEESLRDLED